MTSISDTNVVNAPGGLVELAYNSANYMNTAVQSTPVNLTSVTVVCDGSPIIVEIQCVIHTYAQDGHNVGVSVDGGAIQYSASAGTYNALSTTQATRIPINTQIRLTPSAGVRTFQAKAVSWTGNSANSYIAGSVSIRVSKIIQASQLIVQTPNAPLVTSLPSNAIDGQEVRYLADNTNGIVWNFRYRAGSSSAYKWEFIGGPPLRSENSNYPAGQNSSNWVDITSGATIVPPLSGDYLVEHYGRTDSTNPTAQSLIEISAATSGIAATSVTGAVGFESTLTGVVRGAWARTQKLSGVTANDTIKLQQKMPVGSFSTVFFYTGMFVTPIRVSA